jgi:hypothetical protein
MFYNIKNCPKFDLAKDGRTFIIHLFSKHLATVKFLGYLCKLITRK